jgi:6-phosphogluconolactonase
MQIKIFEDKEALSGYFGDWLLQLSQKHETLNVALSGGSTPKVIFDQLSKAYKENIDWSRIRFFWGDERCVPPTHPESNYLMTRQHLFDNVPAPPTNIFRIQGELAPQQACTQYAGLIDRELPETNGLPCFDIVLLGMGDDGHTASIFPNEISLWDSKELCEVGTHPDSGQKRVTLTGKVINNARHILFLVTGSKKATKVSEIIRHQGDYINYPASRVDSDKTTWLLDKEAAALVNG